MPAAGLPLAAGFLSDAAGLATGATAFGAVVIAAAGAGGLVAGRGRPDGQVAASTGLRNCAEYSR
ncbi:hypothetical protein [Amycolatopsis methanolica]|uniref:hypothetical protein n=1 Tax=Amycolatopsis methanolica TaxID=1814 RepID=UPI0034431848